MVAGVTGQLQSPEPFPAGVLGGYKLPAEA